MSGRFSPSKARKIGLPTLTRKPLPPRRRIRWARVSGSGWRAHLILLLGGNEKIDALTEKAKAELVQQRTFALGKLFDKSDSPVEAQFAFLLSPAGAEGSSTRV